MFRLEPAGSICVFDLSYLWFEVCHAESPRGSLLLSSSLSFFSVSGELLLCFAAAEKVLELRALQSFPSASLHAPTASPDRASFFKIYMVASK